MCCLVAADWGSVTTEDATQNAALAAIMFLAGGVGKDSPNCIITLVGSDPTVRPLLLNCQQAVDMVDRRARHVLREQVSSCKLTTIKLPIMHTSCGQCVTVHKPEQVHGTDVYTCLPCRPLRYTA